ncbi:MAG: SdrD B-like domain-containing protein, partial [Candidatus Neomarinimicrobiota bacterium]
MSFFKKLMILFGISLIAFYGCDKLLGPDPRDSTQNDEVSTGNQLLLAVDSDAASITGPSLLLVNGDKYTIDFEEFQTGEVVDEINLGSAGIVGVHGSHSTSGTENVAIVFNSSVPSGLDFDLGSPNEVAVPSGPGVGAGGESGPFINDIALGKILILAENMVDVNPPIGFIDDPDDTGDLNGLMTFDFSGVGDGWATVIAGMVIDVEHNEQVPNIVFHLRGGGTVDFIYPNTGDNGLYKGDTFQQAFPDGVADVVLMEVFIHGSGGLDNVIILAPGYCSGAIGDFVWNDLDQDGIQDQGEPGLEDIMVRLKQNGVEIARKRTDANGYYEFTGLCAGDYQVFVNAVTLPSGNWVWTLVEQGSDPSVDSNSHPADVTLTDGQVDHTIDFGFYIECDAAIGDFVWNDLNQDGIQDQGEPGLEDVMVRLKQNGVEIRRTRTNANGYYEFAGLCAGDYQVFVNAVTLPSGSNWVWTLVEQGSDPSVDSNSHPADVTLTDGQVDHTIDFGFYDN